MKLKIVVFSLLLGLASLLGACQTETPTETIDESAPAGETETMPGEEEIETEAMPGEEEEIETEAMPGEEAEEETEAMPGEEAEEEIEEEVEGEVEEEAETTP